VGKPLPGIEVRLSGEGELLVRGPNVMRGYWRDPERTAEVIKDGWYATGDLASIDDAGYVRLIGRARDLIVLPSGLNVWPQDVEEALRAEAAVKDAAVLAVPTAGGGATLHAYLLPQRPADRAADPSSLVAHCNGRLAQHQRLASASWWPDSDFPRTALGKVRRTLLPPPEATTSVAVDSVLAADDPVGQAVAAAARVATVADGQELGALGLDSMGLVELAQELEEKTGKYVGDGELRLDMTVAQVRSMLAAAAIVESGTSNGTASKWGGAVPLWPYTWGRIFRTLDFPVDLLYRYAATRTIVLGGEHLAQLGPRVILAGTHHSFADMPLVRCALRQTPARRLAGRLVIATAADGFARGGLAARYGVLGLGLYPLHQRDEREASLRGLARLAAAGNAILIFPQGTHATPEQERPGAATACFRPGVAHLATALQATVVPFGVAGTERTIPAHLADYHGKAVAGVPLSLRRGPLAIAFGAPLQPAAGEEPHAFAARLQGICFALTREAEVALGQGGAAGIALSA
jgi:long-chain acyl-CoA synthetase